MSIHDAVPEVAERAAGVLGPESGLLQDLDAAYEELDARYESVGKIVFACQRAGIVKISFVTEPPPRGG